MSFLHSAAISGHDSLLDVQRRFSGHQKTQIQRPRTSRYVNWHEKKPASELIVGELP